MSFLSMLYQSRYTNSIFEFISYCCISCFHTSGLHVLLYMSLLNSASGNNVGYKTGRARGGGGGGSSNTKQHQMKQSETKAKAMSSCTIFDKTGK